MEYIYIYYVKHGRLRICNHVFIASVCALTLAITFADFVRLVFILAARLLWKPTYRKIVHMVVLMVASETKSPDTTINAKRDESAPVVLDSQ